MPTEAASRSDDLKCNLIIFNIRDLFKYWIVLSQYFNFNNGLLVVEKDSRQGQKYPATWSFKIEAYELGSIL